MSEVLQRGGCWKCPISLVSTEGCPRCSSFRAFVETEGDRTCISEGNRIYNFRRLAISLENSSQRCLQKEQGEKQDADLGAACDWKNDIFNADETALYYRGLPDKGHCEKGFNLTGGKKAMNRITALLCSNMLGTEKRPLLVIGKSKRPCSFPKNLQNLPVEYDSSKKAWMTRDRFTRWL